MRTLTIKNVPDEIYADLAAIAKKNRRSINNEAIMSVERGLDRNGLESQRVLLERIRAQREVFAARGLRVTEEDLKRFKNEGRA